MNFIIVFSDKNSCFNYEMKADTYDEAKIRADKLAISYDWKVNYIISE